MQRNHAKDESFIRILFMVFFAIILNISISVVMIIGFVQWLIRIIRDDEIIRLKEFSASLNEFNYQIGQFLTLNDEKKPFPFTDWPDADCGEDTELKTTNNSNANDDTLNEPDVIQGDLNAAEQESHLQKQQENDLSSDGSIIDQDLTDNEQLDSMKESDS